MPVQISCGVPFPRVLPRPSLSGRERGYTRVAPLRAVLVSVLCPCCLRTAHFGQTKGPRVLARCLSEANARCQGSGSKCPVSKQFCSLALS